MHRPLLALTFSALALAVAAPAPLALAQSAPQAASQADPARTQTLADVRQELTVLYTEIQRLKRELSTTGGVGTPQFGRDVLERINAIEGELTRLTGKTEQMEHRIESVARDGANRIGDLEYRLVELEGGDTAQLERQTTLGILPADPASAPAEAPATGGGTSGAIAGGTELPAPDTETPQLAASESADLRAAQGLLAQGDYAAALGGFETFSDRYPGSPLAPDAAFGKARALEGQGEIRPAAQAYLDSFTLAPEGTNAPEALFKLGSMLSQLGQGDAACQTLAAVTDRFPQSASAQQAAAALSEQGCS